MAAISILVEREHGSRRMEQTFVGVTMFKDSGSGLEEAGGGAASWSLPLLLLLLLHPCPSALDSDTLFL